MLVLLTVAADGDAGVAAAVFEKELDDDLKGVFLTAFLGRSGHSDQVVEIEVEAIVEAID